MRPAATGVCGLELIVVRAHCYSKGERLTNPNLFAIRPYLEYLPETSLSLALQNACEGVRAGVCVCVCVCVCVRARASRGVDVLRYTSALL